MTWTDVQLAAQVERLVSALDAANRAAGDSSSSGTIVCPVCSNTTLQFSADVSKPYRRSRLRKSISVKCATVGCVEGRGHQ